MKILFITLIFGLEILTICVYNQLDLLFDLAPCILFFLISFILNACYVHYDYLSKEVASGINMRISKIEVIFLILTAIFFSQLEKTHLNIANDRDFYLYVIFLLSGHLMGFVTPFLIRKKILV